MKLSKNTDISVKWVVNDLWIGCYFNKERVINYLPFFEDYKILKIYICLIPCFPIIIKIKIK